MSGCNLSTRLNLYWSCKNQYVVEVVVILVFRAISSINMTDTSIYKPVHHLMANGLLNGIAPICVIV